MNLDHINIKAPMPLLQKEKAFFCEVLDCEDGFRPEFSNRGFWLYLDDHPVIHLTETDADPAESGKQGWVDHLAFKSSGARSFIARLDEQKIAYTTSYVKETDALQIFIRSPLGNRIEVIFVGEKISQTVPQDRGNK